MAGNIDTRTEIIPAGGVVQLPNANFLFIVSSSGNVVLQLKRQGLRPGAAQENYSGQLAGLQVSRTNAWDFASMTGAPGVSITFIYGNVAIRDDATLFNQQIAVISGITAVAAAPSNTFVTAQIAPVTGAAVTVAANLTRRRITFCSPSTNTGSVFLQKTGDGAGKGIELQPGLYIEIDNTQAIDVRNDSGATQTINTFEET
jgi:hypothetical protein